MEPNNILLDITNFEESSSVLFFYRTFFPAVPSSPSFPGSPLSPYEGNYIPFILLETGNSFSFKKLETLKLASFNGYFRPNSQRDLVVWRYLTDQISFCKKIEKKNLNISAKIFIKKLVFQAWPFMIICYYLRFETVLTLYGNYMRKISGQFLYMIYGSELLVLHVIDF